MPGILSPTRGGEASYPNQDRAIQLAKERQVPLHFLYVADARFIHKPSGPITIDLEQELGEMGEFLLTMAQERAEEQGIEAAAHLRRGAFREAMADVIQEQAITTVVLGSPSGATRITSEEYLEVVTEFLVEEQGVEVFVVHDGRIVMHRGPGTGPPEK